MTSARNEKHIIIIIIIIISFMQGILTYIPETNYVHSVAAILLLLFMVLIPSVSVLTLLYIYISTFRSMCAVIIIIIIIIIIGGGGHFERCALQHKCQFSVPFSTGCSCLPLQKLTY